MSHSSSLSNILNNACFAKTLSKSEYKEFIIHFLDISFMEDGVLGFWGHNMGPTIATHSKSKRGGQNKHIKTREIERNRA